MSCFGYLPNPPSTWTRETTRCDPHSQEYRKAIVLQYYGNSASVTAAQKYASIARGKWTNRTTTFSTQTETFTNPNTLSLVRINFFSVPVPSPAPFPASAPLPQTSGLASTSVALLPLPAKRVAQTAVLPYVMVPALPPAPTLFKVGGTLLARSIP